MAATDHQTGGKGRQGRRWVAPPGSSLLVSVLLQPPADRRLPELSLVAALAAAEAIEAATGLSTQIKWPNDVMLNRRKVAGILAELSDGVVSSGSESTSTSHATSSRSMLRRSRARSARSPGSSYEPRGDPRLAALRDSSSTTTRGSNGGLDAVYGGIGARDFLRGRRITVDGEEALGVQIQRDGRLEISTGNGHGATRAIESGEVLFER